MKSNTAKYLILCSTLLIGLMMFQSCSSDDSGGGTPNIPDDDNDGIINVLDDCPNTPAGETVDSSGCSDSQLDEDGDGVPDISDDCPDTPMGEAVNGDGCSDSQIDDPDNVFGLDPNLEPWENFDLSDWVIDTPAVDPSDGNSQRYGELEWDELVNSASRPFFFTHDDGGMRFVCTVGGARTSQNTAYVRSELREMLRAGNTSISTQGPNGNNWALGYQPTGTDHGGRNGELKATLKINEVTTTGNGRHPGRLIIGQIHADNDEPARLYYRKPPNATFGCLYVEHEIRDGNDVTFNLIGDEDCEGNGPSNGIQLDELFSYEIINEGEDITVIIRRGDEDGEIIAQTTIDMNDENSGYDRADEWMYYKAGVYTQNNTGDNDDQDIVTFYRLSNTHD